MFIRIKTKLQYAGIYENKDGKLTATFKNDNGDMYSLGITREEKERLELSEHYEISINRH